MRKRATILRRRTDGLTVKQAALQQTQNPPPLRLVPGAQDSFPGLTKEHSAGIIDAAAKRAGMTIEGFARLPLFEQNRLCAVEFAYLPDTLRFDLMVIGEIVEAHNQSMDWWDRLAPERQVNLYQQQLARPPRKSP